MLPLVEHLCAADETVDISIIFPNIVPFGKGCSVAYTYEATFSMERWHGLPNNWVQCEGIRLESNIAIAIVQDICKALKDAGKPDGSIAFFKDGRTQPTYTYPSIYEIVARIGAPSLKRPSVEARESAGLAAPTMISNTVYLALTQLDADVTQWRNVHGRTRGVLLDRGYVSVDDEVPKITEIGRQAMETYQDTKTTYPADLATASQAELLDAAAIIGLKTTTSVGRALKFIETTIAKHSFEQIEAMAWKVHVPVRLGRTKSEDMKKRRVLAAIMNAGKLAQAM